MRLIVGAWIAAVVAGFGAWGLSERTPGPSGISANDQPLTRSVASVTVYVHPQCPCTRDALPSLIETLVEANHAGADCRVVFVRPTGVPKGWERTRTWEIAAGQPGVIVEVDPDGVRAAADGAKTSGHAVVRNAAGKVVFRGGISRPGGRTQDAAGFLAITAVLAGKEPEIETAPTFGCPLETPAD